MRNSEFTAIVFSSSVRGEPIAIAATASPGTTIHATGAVSGQVDRIFAWVTNTSTATVELTIEFGTTGTSAQLKKIIPAKETINVLNGVLLGGSSAETIRMFAATGSVLNVVGNVERIPA